MFTGPLALFLCAGLAVAVLVCPAALPKVFAVSASTTEQAVCRAVQQATLHAGLKLDGIQGGSVADLTFIASACSGGSSQDFPIHYNTGWKDGAAFSPLFLIALADGPVRATKVQVKRTLDVVLDKQSNTVLMNMTVQQTQHVSGTIDDKPLASQAPLLVVASAVASFRPGSPASVLWTGHLATESHPGESLNGKVVAQDPDLFDGHAPAVFTPSSSAFPDPAAMLNINAVNMLLGKVFLRLPPLQSSPSAARGAARRAWLETDLVDAEELTRLLEPSQALYRPSGESLDSGVLLQRDLLCGSTLPGQPDCPSFVHHDVLAFANEAVEATPCHDKLSIVEGSLLSQVTVDLYATSHHVYVRNFRAQTTASVECSEIASGPASLAVTLTITSPNTKGSLWPHGLFSNVHLPTLPLQLVQALKAMVHGTVHGTLDLPDTGSVGDGPKSVTTFLPGNVFRSHQHAGTALSDVAFATEKEALAFLRPTIEAIHQQLQTGHPTIDSAVAAALPTADLSASISTYMSHALNPTALGFWTWFPSQRTQGLVDVEVFAATAPTCDRDNDNDDRSNRSNSNSNSQGVNNAGSGCSRVGATPAAELVLSLRLGATHNNLPRNQKTLQPAVASVNTVMKGLPGAEAKKCICPACPSSWDPHLAAGNITHAELDYILRSRTTFQLMTSRDSNSKSHRNSVGNSTKSKGRSFSAYATSKSNVVVAGSYTLHGPITVAPRRFEHWHVRASYDIASNTVALHINTTFFDSALNAPMLSIPPTPEGSPGSAQLSCLHQTRVYDWPTADAANKADDLLKLQVVDLDTFPLQLTRWPLTTTMQDIAVRTRVVLANHPKARAAEVLPVLEAALKGASHPEQGLYVSATAARLSPASDPNTQACDVWVHLATTHNVTVTNEQTSWQWLLGTDRLHAELTLTGGFHLHLDGSSAQLTNFRLKGSVSRANFALPSLLSMQSGSPLSSSFRATVDLPSSASTRLNLRVKTDFGATPEFVIEAHHKSGDHGGGSTSFGVRDRALQQAVSPSGLLSTLRHSVLKMVPRALAGSLKFKVPAYQKSLDELSGLEHVIDEAASLLTIPGNPDPTLASSSSCLAVMEKEPQMTLSVILFNGQNDPVQCPLSSLDFSNWHAYITTFNEALKACGVDSWLRADVLPDTVGATEIGGKPCATLRLRPAVPGALTYLSVKTQPASKNLTLSTTKSTSAIPLFGLFEDFLTIAHGVFMKELPRPKLNAIDIPAQDANIPPELSTVYPAKLTGIGFDFKSAYNNTAHTTTPLDDKLSADHGIFKAFLRNGTASAGVQASASAGIAIAFDCPPPNAGKNVTVWSSLNKSQELSKTKVPPAPNNTFDLTVAGQFRVPHSPLADESGNPGLVSNGTGKIKVHRVSAKFHVTLQEGAAAEAAMQALVHQAPAWLSPHLGVSSRQRTRKGRQQIAITASRAQFANGTWWIPDTISVTDSTIEWFNDTSVSLPLTKPMMSAVDLHAHADLKAGAREAEADVSILDVKARDIRGSTSLSIDIRLLPPPPKTSNDTDSSTSMEPVMTASPLHPSPSRGCAASSGSCADARRPRFYDISTLNHALRQPDSFYSFFEASIDLNTQFQLHNLTVGVDDVAVVTTGAGIELSMSDNFTLDVGFKLHDMVNHFKFQTKFRGKDSFIRAMRSALSINATSLCWFMEQLLEPSSRVHRSQVGVHPLPFASKAVHDWLGPYTGAAEKAVEAVCDGGSHADIQVVCAVLQETFGHPVCTRSTLQTDKLVLDIEVDLVNSSATDQFKYDAKRFEPIKHKPSLSIGESSSGTLVSSVDIAAKATLVIDLSGPIPKPSVRGGSLSMAVSVHGQGTVKVWFGPMPVPFSDVELSLGDPVKLTVSFGEHDDVGPTGGALVPAQGMQGRVTGGDAAGTGLEEADGVTLEGSASLMAKVNIPFTDPCRLKVKIPQITAFLLNPSSDTFHFSTPGCPDGLLGKLLRALPEFGFQHALQDFGRLIAQWERKWEEFLRDKLGLGGLLDGLHIPVLDGKWWMHVLHVHLGEIFGPHFFKKLLAYLQPKLHSLNLSGIGKKIKDVEKLVLRWFTEALHFLLQPWHIHWPNIPDVADKTYKWQIALHGTLKQKPEELAFDLGNHGIASLDFDCDEEAEFYWSVNFTLAWSPHHGIELIFNANPALQVQVELDVPKCDLLGSFLIAGIEIGAKAKAQAGIKVIPPTFTKDQKWDFELDAEGHLGGNAIVGFAGVFTNLLHKDVPGTIQALPNVHTNLACSFNCTIKGCSNAPLCRFGKPHLCVGQVLTSLLHHALAFTDSQFFENARRMVAFLEQEVDLRPVLPEMHLVDVLQEFADLFCHGRCDFDGVFETIDDVAAVISLIEELKNLEKQLDDPTCSRVTHNMQEFSLDFSQSDLKPQGHGQKYPPNQINTQGLAAEHASSIRGIWNSVTVKGSFNIKLPFLEHPLEDLLKVLLGFDVPLVNATFPSLVIDVEASWFIGPVWTLPSVYVELGLQAQVQAQVPPMIVTSKTAISVFQSKDLGQMMRSLRLQVANEKTHALLPVFHASVTLGGHVGIGVSIGVVGFYGDLYVGLTVNGALSLPNIHGTNLISIGDVLHLVRLNGNVYDATVRTYDLVISLGFGIRGCVSLFWKTWCYTVVSIQTHITPWSTTSNPTLFVSPGSGSGLVNLDAAHPETSRGAGQLQCSGACETTPTFTLTQAKGEIDVSVKSTTDGAVDPPRSIPLPAKGDCITFTGDAGGKLRVRLIGVLRCVQLPAKDSMAIEFPGTAYVRGSTAEHAVRTRHSVRTSPSGETCLSLEPRRRSNSTSAKRPTVQLSPKALLADGAAGTYFGDRDSPTGRACGTLNVSSPFSGALVEATGTPCRTRFTVGPSEDVRLRGYPSDYDLVFVGRAGNVSMDMNVTEMVVRNSSVMLDATTIAFTEPPFYLTTRGHPSGSAHTTIQRVAPAAVVTCIGGRGNNTFAVPDPSTIEGSLHIRGSLTDASNLLRVHNNIHAGSGSLTITPTSLSLNNSRGFHHFGVMNMDFFDVHLTTSTGAQSVTTVVTPERFTAVNVRSAAEEGATVQHRLNGCVDGTSWLEINLAGPGNQEVLIGSGSLANFNCRVTIVGSSAKHSSGNATIIINAGRDDRDLVWQFGEASLQVSSRDAYEHTNLHVDMRFIDQIYVRYGNASNKVEVVGADETAELVFDFPDSAAALDPCVLQSPRGNVVYLRHTERAVALLGRYRLCLSYPDTDNYEPFTNLLGVVLSLGVGKDTATPIELVAGEEAKHAQEMVLHDRCISAAAPGTENPKQVQHEPSPWIQMHAAARGWIPTVNMSHCQVMQPWNATLSASLSNMDDAVFLRGFSIYTMMDMLGGADTFDMQNGSASQFYVRGGSGRDSFQVDNGILDSTLDFGDDHDLDTLSFYANGHVPGVISASRIGPVDCNDPTAYLHLVNNRIEDVTYIRSRRTQALAALHAGARMGCQARMPMSAASFDTDVGQERAVTHGTANRFPGGNAVSHVSYPEQERTLVLEPQSAVTYVIDAVGTGTVIQINGHPPSSKDRRQGSVGDNADAADGPSTAPTDWQVIASLQDYDAAGIVQVLGTETSNATVGMVAPSTGQGQLRLTGEHDTSARLTYGAALMRAHKVQHLLLMSNGTSDVVFDGTSFPADVVVVAATHAQMVWSASAPPSKPLLLVNASVDLSQSAVISAGSIVLGGPSSSMQVSLPSVRRGAMQAGCWSLWDSDSSDRINPATPSPWMSGWLGLLLPPEHARQLFLQGCSLFFSHTERVVLRGVNDLLIDNPRQHVLQLFASHVSTANVSDSHPISDLRLSSDTLSVDNDTIGYNITFDDPTLQTLQSTDSTPRRVTLWQPTFKRRAAAITVVGAPCSSNAHTRWLTGYGPHAPTRDMGLEFAGQGATGHLELRDHADNLRIDLRSLVTSLVCKNFTGHARFTLGQGQQQQQQQDLHRAEAAEELNIFVRQSSVNFSDAVSGHERLVELGPSHSALNFSIGLLTGRSTIRFQPQWHETWPIPLGLEVEQGAFADVYMPAAMGVRLPTRDVDVHFREQTFQASGQVERDADNGFLLVPGKDCTRAAFEAAETNRQDRCKATFGHSATSRRDANAAFRLVTPQRSACELPDGKGTAAHIGVGTPAAGRIGVNNVSAFKGLYAAWYCIVCLSFGGAWVMTAFRGWTKATDDSIRKHAWLRSLTGAAFFGPVALTGTLYPLLKDGSSTAARELLLIAADVVTSLSWLGDSCNGEARSDRVSTVSPAACTLVALVSLAVGAHLLYQSFGAARGDGRHGSAKLVWSSRVFQGIAELGAVLLMPWALYSTVDAAFGFTCVFWLVLLVFLRPLHAHLPYLQSQRDNAISHAERLPGWLRVIRDRWWLGSGVMPPLLVGIAAIISRPETQSPPNGILAYAVLATITFVAELAVSLLSMDPPCSRLLVGILALASLAFGISFLAVINSPGHDTTPAVVVLYVLWTMVFPLATLLYVCVWRRLRQPEGYQPLQQGVGGHRQLVHVQTPGTYGNEGGDQSESEDQGGGNGDGGDGGDEESSAE